MENRLPDIGQMWDCARMLVCRNLSPPSAFCNAGLGHYAVGPQTLKTAGVKRNNNNKYSWDPVEVNKKHINFFYD